MRTFSEIQNLTLLEVVHQVHIIIGPNGMCMCGCYDGYPVTCLDILKQDCQEIASAAIGSEFIQKHGGTKTNPAA